jgi:hypothetical protein
MISRAQINGIKDFDTRTILLGMYDQLDAHNQALGIPLLTPVNSKTGPASAPPPSASILATGANGTIGVAISNPPQSINKTIWHEVSYSDQSNFTSGVTTLKPTTSLNLQLPMPGSAPFIRIRSSYDQQNWNSYTYQSGAVDAGLQTSAATENHVVLNQTNYATVDSVDGAGSANVRIYGKSGVGTQYPSTKGGIETLLPSATIIGVPYGSSPVVAHDGANYQVRNTLPEVLSDANTPIGSVSVVNAGAVVPPEISLVVNGGHIIAWNVTNQGNGLTGDVSITVTSSGGGTGATPGAQTIKNGKLISVAPGNPGTGYASGDTVNVSGGQFSGSPGGGQSVGGNGGRLVYNDGTTN